MKNETRGWPPKRRAAYAARIRKTKIWRFSSGPRSADGKTRASKNAITHGAYTAQWQIVRAALLAQRQFLKMLEQILKIFSIEPLRPKNVWTKDLQFQPWWDAPDIRDGNIEYFFRNFDEGLVG